MMKLIISLACLLAVLTAVSAINGGQEAVPHSAPFMILIQRKILTITLTSNCAGSLITVRSILTAAQCAPTLILNILITQTAVAGDHRISTTDATEQRRKIVEFHSHPDYAAGLDGPNDIAVANVATPFELNLWVGLIALPIANVIPAAGSNCTLYGWGSTSVAPLPSDVLRVVNREIITLAECRATSYNELAVGDTNLCTGPVTQDNDACDGDTGGPLVQRNNGILEVIGTTSWGEVGCGVGPYVKVQVSAFIPFINQYWL